jgi:CHAT domain-containing protein
VKKLVCILVVLYSATVACNGNDPISEKKGRPAEQRLSKAGPHDPVDLLIFWKVAADTIQRNPTSEMALYTRAFAQELLGLTDEARKSWNEVVKYHRSDEAIRHRDAPPDDPSSRWDPEKLKEALRARDRATVTRMAGAFPADAERYFEKTDLADVNGLRILADVLLADGDAYASDVLDAAQRTQDRESLRRGVEAFQKALTSHLDDDYARAATLLERARSPLHLAARYEWAADRFSIGEDALPLLDTITTDPCYRDLSSRVYTLRANALELHGSYLKARDSYADALAAAKHDPTAMARVFARRSVNYSVMGEAEKAFSDAVAALKLLPRVVDLNTRHHAYGAAATAAWVLGYGDVARQYRDAAVMTTTKAVIAASADTMKEAKHHRAIALRERADTLVGLERDTDAKNDLDEAIRLAEAIGDPPMRKLLRMRAEEVQGQMLLKQNPAEAVARFTEAIDLAAEQDSTYRAVLHFKRGAARLERHDPNADDDFVAALAILRKEARLLLKEREHRYEERWSQYFSRFQQIYQDLIARRIDEGDIAHALVYAEQARAFEPMDLLLRSRSVPPGFRKIESVADLQRARAALPEDTAILQYVVLPDRTYTFVLTRERLDAVPQPVSRADIERWVQEVNDAVERNQPSKFDQPMLAAYDRLFRAPLRTIADKKQLVIVSDGPMYGLPFAGLRGTKAEGYLIGRYALATAGSTSLYLYALARDGQFKTNDKPTALIVGNPPSQLPSLPNAEEEAIQLARDYPGSELLLGADATIDRFLASARQAYIVHFAGHALPSPTSPRNSMLLLAPHGSDTGELTAERLMTELSELQRTRLVVLAACSTAGGQPVGPEGVAPLVRPIIAANVPAVVGTLWNVNDATAKDLMLSLHCHYRNGDDVAVALQKAQLAMLRKQVPAMYWAPFQVVGYAASPYARPIAMEKTPNDDLCSQDPLHRPDGLHPQ